MNNHQTTIYGTAGGTLLSVFGNLQTGDVFRTVILAMIGATTSFFISLGWKWAQKKLARRI